MKRWTTTIAIILLAGSVLAVAPGTVSAEEAPPEGAAGTGWRQVSAGGLHTCGIRTSGRLYCWGDDSQGQLGNGGANVDRMVPGQVAGGGTNWTAVSAGFMHTCARRSTGRLYCWGDDVVGQLGDDGRVQDRNTPIEVQGRATDWTAFSAGASHTCALKQNGRLYCWGYDLDGQLGNGGADSSSTIPVQVAGNATNWRTVTAGYSHTCAVRTNGRLFCWGLDDHGQVGDGGTYSHRSVPVRIGAGTNWRSVAAGWSHTCGLRAPGRLFCWGADDAGQVGNGGPGTANQPRPVAVLSALTDWTAVTAGTAHTCARRANGRLYCWGWDDNGQVGNGTPEFDESVPFEVLGNRTDWASVDAGGEHTCARLRSGRPFCWGDDDGQGQLGDGPPATDQASPVAVL